MQFFLFSITLPADSLDEGMVGLNWFFRELSELHSRGPPLNGAKSTDDWWHRFEVSEVQIMCASNLVALNQTFQIWTAHIKRKSGCLHVFPTSPGSDLPECLVCTYMVFFRAVCVLVPVSMVSYATKIYYVIQKSSHARKCQYATEVWKKSIITIKLSSIRYY